MYIPEFVCGVVATFLFEILVAIIWNLVSGGKK